MTTPDKPTSEEAVGEIAKTLAEIERDMRKHIRQVRRLRKHFQTIERNGEVGSLAPMAAFARLSSLVTGNLASMLDEHLRETREAQDGGIDVDPMAEDDDDAEDGVVVYSSGGGR